MKNKSMSVDELKQKLTNGGLHVDAVTKKGNYFIRRGYYYRHGYSEYKMAEQLKAIFPDAVIVKKWDRFVPFRGGDTVTQGSHFGIEFSLPEKETV